MTVEHARQHSPSDLAISAITCYELMYGVERSSAAWRKKEEGKVRMLLGQLIVLPFVQETAARAAAIRVKLEAAGQSIGPMDILIAATGLEHDLLVVTNKLREFQRVPALRCVNWSV